LAMDELVPDAFRGLIDRLRQLAAEQDLIERARAGCAEWFRNGPEDLPYALGDVRLEFASHTLCFRNAVVSYPYVETRLALFVGDREVGAYRLITRLDGTAADDYLVFG